MLFRRFRNISQAVDRAQRFRAIIGVFLRYGYEDLARRLPLPSGARLPFRSMRDAQAEIALLTPAERLRRAFEELGPTFVKLGQLLSTRRHLLPPAFIVELSKLHDQAPAAPFEQVMGTITVELGRPPLDVFLSIDPVPVGSASIAQVHPAILRTGEPCVIKVQRPGIDKLVHTDLEIMAQIAGLLEKHVDGWKALQPTAVVAEFARRIEQEMDFKAEAAHVERFALQFSEDPTVYTPKIFHAFSTRRVLTMERIEAIKASEIECLDAAMLDRKEIATRITDLMMKQIFLHGFFHADPHPGNIHILPGQVICFLDFGMMGYLDEHTRETFAKFVDGVSQRDEKMAASALLRLANAELDPTRQGFEADVAEFMSQHFYRPVGEMIFMRLVNDLFQLTVRHNLTMPPDIFTMLKALGLTENVVARLDPGHDLLAQARPILQEAHLKRIHPHRLWRESMEVGGALGWLVRELPLEARRLAAQIREGKLKMMLHHGGFEDLLATMERVINRLSFALVLSSLMIASAVIVHARVPPLWHDVSVVGVAGYFIAGIMGFWLLIAMLRHGKM